jgi:hypothetical protein
MDTNDRNVNLVVEKIVKSKGKEGMSALDIIDEAVRMGWDRVDVENAIQFLRDKSVLYVSTGGIYKAVN